MVGICEAVYFNAREVSEELMGRISRLKMKRGQSDLSTESGDSLSSRAWTLLSFWASEKEELKDSGDYFSCWSKGA